MLPQTESWDFETWDGHQQICPGGRIMHTVVIPRVPQLCEEAILVRGNNCGPHGLEAHNKHMLTHIEGKRD